MRRVHATCTALVLFVVVAVVGRADDLPEPAPPSLGRTSETVSPVGGSFSQVVPISVPAFRGLQPRLALGYASEGGDGFAGVGWGLSGFSSIQRTRADGRGTPRYDASDAYVLDGQVLLPCLGLGANASCTALGSHTTKTESYLKVNFNALSNTWTVTGRDGTRTVFSSILVNGALGTFRWGQTSVADLNGNTVSYVWACTGGDCYPDEVIFGPYSVKLYRQTRTQPASFAMGGSAGLGWTLHRLRSIKVSYAGSPVRAYELAYQSSVPSGRSLLTSVRQYGSDVQIDGNGLITGGTSLPARTFVYAPDSGARAFHLWGN